MADDSSKIYFDTIKWILLLQVQYIVMRHVVYVSFRQMPQTILGG